MKINPDIFKSRDIRGIYPEELDEEVAFRIGQAFVAKTGACRIVIGSDMRTSSPILFKSLIKGILSQGSVVFNIGLVPTECLYFALANYDYEAGIMITASHNPKEYNGFKMFKKKNKGLEFVRGKDLADLIRDYPIREGGRVEEIDIWEEYLTHIFSFVDLNKINPFKVVIDAGNGMAGKVIEKIKNRLPCEIISLNFELDGNFPSHPSNPLENGASSQVCTEVVQKNADFGFIFDGDADRIYLIDENGSFVQGDITLLLLAKCLLAKDKNKGIAYNLICSKAVPEFIKKWQGKPIRTAVGVVELKEGMEKNDGIMGGELSGHYLFRDNYYMDSGIISFLILLQIISESGKEVSEMIKEFSLYSKSAEINFRVDNKEEIINKTKENFSGLKQDYLDGLTVEYDDWWFNLRPSQTESLLRLTIEANTKDILEEKKAELSKFINKLS